MTKTITKTVLAILLVSLPFMSFSQTDSAEATASNPKSNRSAYIGLSAGISFGNFRDFATSPLVYKGMPKYYGASFIRMNKFRETEIRVSTQMGNYSITVGNETVSSSATFVDLQYTRLFRWNNISSDKWNFKYGGILKMTGDFRSNESLQNNAVGMELFTNIMAAFKVSHDMSRTESKDRKFLWIKHRVQPRKRILSYHLNVGVINSSFRNGWAYNSQANVVGDFGPFSGYETKVFSGFRMTSQLDYTIYLKNKNAVQLSYIWDAAKTGGDYDKFEIASHTFKFTFMFNTNNK